MTQTELHRAISRATGEDVDLVARRGFSLVDDEAPLVEDDLELLTLDWDAIQAAQHAAGGGEIPPVCEARCFRQPQFRNPGRDSASEPQAAKNLLLSALPCGDCTLNLLCKRPDVTLGNIHHRLIGRWIGQQRERAP